MIRHLHNLKDLGPDGLVRVLDLAVQLKAERGKTQDKPLAGKQIAIVFEKASTRTRLSLEIAVSELGGHPIVLTSSGSQMARGEPMKDTARVLSRMVHGITLRTHDESRLLEMIQHVEVPVLNALTDQSHPMQLLADLMTMRERFGKLAGLEVCFIGDGNNMANSFIEAAWLCGYSLRLACPEGFDPDPRFLAEAQAKGAKVKIFRKPAEAIAGAQVVSTDVFASMGQEAEAERRLQAFAGYTVDSKLMSLADPSAIVLHCLPAHRGEEITDEVMEGPQSAIWDEAEARLHTAKAALLWAFGLV